MVLSIADPTLIRQAIRSAFKQIRSDGHFARMDFMCCQTCACAEIVRRAPHKFYVYYHHQDTAAMNDGHGLCLAYAQDRGFAEYLVGVLKAHGLRVEWNGNLSQRIVIPGVI